MYVREYVHKKIVDIILYIEQNIGYLGGGEIMENKKVKVIVKDITVSMGCSDGQLRPGKGNRNGEC